MATPKSKKKASHSKIEEEDEQDVYVITCHCFCDYCYYINCLYIFDREMVSLNSPKKTRKAVKVEEEAPEDGEEEEVVKAEVDVDDDE